MNISMRLTLCVGILMAGLVANLAGAEVTMNTSGGSKVGIGGEMSALLGDKRLLLRRLPAPDITAAAMGLNAVITAEHPRPMEYTDAWLASLPEPEGDANWQCLSEAVYFEARGERLKGQFAVAEVILNRVDSPLYPRSICGVVKQRGGGGCQFSYVCDGHADRMRDPQARDRAERIARAMLDGAPRRLTEGATYFHATNVRPSWARRFDKTASIGAHVFYREPDANG